MTLPGFVTCPTCGGTGSVSSECRYEGNVVSSCTVSHFESCPDCVAGQVPSPETVEAAAMSLFYFKTLRDADESRRMARAVLLEYARHVQEGEK